MNKLVFASVISEIQQSDIFMTVKARICEAPAANLNGARVTEAFIDEIVGNPDRYVGLPLYADVRALTSGNYRRLGHLYDSKTGEFHSTQIGSFYQFEKEEFKQGEEKGCYLVGYARIAKRNKKLSKAISELFTDGALKFSFEVVVGEYEELDDDTILIDASDSNYLEGTAIVTFPACEEAVALELVAQRKADDTEGGEKEMADTKVAEAVEVKTTAEAANPEAEKPTEAVATVNAQGEVEVVEETAETETAHVEEAAESNSENAEGAEEPEAQPETAETQTAETVQENAAVVIHEVHREQQSTYAYDTESGVDVSQIVSVETSVSHVEPDASLVEADDGIHIATVETAEDPDAGDGGATPSDPDNSGESGDSSTEDPVAENGDANDSEPAAEDPVLPGEKEKKTAEQLIAELASVVESLKAEVEELKAQKTVVAEKKTVTAEVNPFIDSISTEGTGYSLLKKTARKEHTSYSLLTKA